MMPYPPVPVAKGRGREISAVALWVLAGGLWLAALRLPWVDAGVLGGTSPVDGARVVLSGIGDVPSALGYLLVVVPVCAALLVGLSPVRGAGALVGRFLLWLLLNGVGVTALVLVNSRTAGSLAAGGWCVIAAAVVGLVALVLSTLRKR